MVPAWYNRRYSINDGINGKLLWIGDETVMYDSCGRISKVGMRKSYITLMAGIMKIGSGNVFSNPQGYNHQNRMPYDYV